MLMQSEKYIAFKCGLDSRAKGFALQYYSTMLSCYLMDCTCGSALPTWTMCIKMNSHATGLCMFISNLISIHNAVNETPECWYTHWLIIIAVPFGSLKTHSSVLCRPRNRVCNTVSILTGRTKL